MIARVLPLAGLAALAACAAPPSAAPPPTVPPPPPCPVSASSGWQAYVDAMPGPDRREATLHVSGTIALPDAGWTATLTRTAVFETDPVQVRIDVVADPPPNPGPGPVSREVSGAWPSEKQVGSVEIFCRGTSLARIAPVVTAL